MQFPGTTPFGSFGAAALTGQLTPQSLAARKQALIAKLAQGQASRPAFPGSGTGLFGGGGLLNAFMASSLPNFYGGGQFYGGVGSAPPTPSAPPSTPPSTPGGISTGQDSGSGGQGVPAAPPSSPAAPGPGGITGGLNESRTYDPSIIQALAALRINTSSGGGRMFAS